MANNYPLSWPPSEPRTPGERRDRARFSTRGWSHNSPRALTVADSISRLWKEIGHLGVTQYVLSTNIPTRSDGFPRSGAREPEDSGVCLYATIEKKPYCFPCDKWDRVADNIAAIAAHIGAMRGQERWGVGSIAKNFAGYLSLPAPGAVRPWREVLGISKDSPLGKAEQSYKHLARRHHPDAGGDPAVMAELNRAIAEARA